ncbi:MAG: TIR domain-containing protein [Pseudanabaena sp.]|jgi:hypothetical protein
MAKRVFFSFHYQDVIDFRANVVRNHWLTKPDRESAGFFDASIWETAKKTGDIALKRLINSGINGTSSTCVLIGSSTYLRRWVRYEIMRSFKKGNSVFGIHINSIKDKNGNVKALGYNPFDYLGVHFSDSGLTVTLQEWKNDKWRLYDELDSSASYRCNTVLQDYRGKFFQLSQLKPVYNWVEDDGYNNFAKWVFKV